MCVNFRIRVVIIDNTDKIHNELEGEIIKGGEDLGTV